ncbi:MAG: alpha/beta hydrolase [Candidatus Ancillula sp.]|nr:alpha/beta hydrolase [Candidatus Ancillula sp.]
MFIAILAVALFGAIFALRHYGLDALWSKFTASQNVSSTRQDEASDLGEWQKQNFTAYYNQEIKWGACEDLDASQASGADALPSLIKPTEFECADVKAPLIWSEPSAELAKDYTLDANPYDSGTQASINLHIAREKLSTYPGKSLYFNPGGPGASGVSYLPQIISEFPDSLRAAYDITTWDPRGVGKSSPIECFENSAEELKFVYTSIPGQMPDNYDATLAEASGFQKSCADHTGSLLKYIDTQSAARDLNLISALIGSDKTDYIGFSYGTDLGAVYAGLFPQNVGKYVLDGAALPGETLEQTALAQAGGFQVALNAYLEDCITTSASTCPFAGQTVEYANSWIAASIKKLKDTPLKTSTGRELNDIGFFYGLAYTLYSKESWMYLSLALESLKKSASPDIFLILSDAYFEYNSRTEHFESNMFEGNIAVNCLDRQNAFDMEGEAKNADEIMKVAPTLGSFFVYPEVSCEPFTKATNQIKYDQSAPDTGSILVIGTLRDPATPYQSAEEMAKMFKNGVLLTYDSDGHTAFLSDTGELQKAVVAYFIDGTVPENGSEYKP